MCKINDEIIENIFRAEENVSLDCTVHDCSTMGTLERSQAKPGDLDRAIEELRSEFTGLYEKEIDRGVTDMNANYTVRGTAYSWLLKTHHKAAKNVFDVEEDEDGIDQTDDDIFKKMICVWFLFTERPLCG